MKSRNKVILAGAACAVSLGLGLVGSVYADSSVSTMKIYLKDVSTGDTKCTFYDPSSANLSNKCTVSTYGEYNATSKTLDLNDGVNGLQVVFVGSSNDSCNIKASADINAGLYSSATKATIIFDLEEHSWTGGETFSVPSESTFILKSGALNLVNSFAPSLLSIEDGVLSVTGVDNYSTVSADKFIMEDGKLNIMNGRLSVKEKAEISGGEISIKSGSGVSTLIDLSQGTTPIFELKGGTIKLDGEKVNAGISSSKNDTSVIISGGELEIDNTTYGIQLTSSGTASDSAVIFDGGTTVIKNASKYAVNVKGVADYKKAIVFNDGIGIVEPEYYVFYDEDTFGPKDSYWTGIVATDTLTIAEGGTVKRVAAWEIGDDDEEDKLKVPDTGAFSSSNSAVVVAVSLASLATVSGALYMIRYALKRKNSKVGFKK